jgi:hypothetical protein
MHLEQVTMNSHKNGGEVPAARLLWGVPLSLLRLERLMADLQAVLQSALRTGHGTAGVTRWLPPDLGGRAEHHAKGDTSGGECASLAAVRQLCTGLVQQITARCLPGGGPARDHGLPVDTPRPGAPRMPGRPGVRLPSAGRAGRTALLVPRDPYAASGSECLVFVLAYLRLLRARGEARARHADPLASPVPLGDFRPWDSGDTVLFRLLFQGHAEHLRLTPGSPPAPCPLARSLLLDDASAFALSDAGEEFAGYLVSACLDPENVRGAGPGDLLVLGRLTPSYNSADRVFAWGCHVLKCFRQPADNQEIVLCSFEEVGWPDWLDDPLPRAAGQNPKRHLHDTIRDLNRHQALPLIHFKGDGSGERMGWEYR